MHLMPSPEPSASRVAYKMPDDREPRFEDGQKVICIRPAYGLERWKVYTIESCWGPNPQSFNYYLEGDPSVIPYKEERFEPYDAERFGCLNAGSFPSWA